MQGESPSTTAAKLRLRSQQELDAILEARLPGWETFLASDPKIGGWMGTLQGRVINAIRDEDEVRLRDALASIAKAWRRVNELVAEAYRQTTQPEAWELRYIRWMKVAFIRFSSPMGDFYVVPRASSHHPRPKHWYTVDEMLTFLKPPMAALLQMTGTLPEMGATLPGPGPDEKILRIDATGPVVTSTYLFHKSKGIRRE